MQGSFCGVMVCMLQHVDGWTGGRISPPEPPIAGPFFDNYFVMVFGVETTRN
jgi:hypothetical protein